MGKAIKRRGGRLAGKKMTKYVIAAVIVALVLLLIYHMWKTGRESKEDLRDEMDENLIREAEAHGLLEEAKELRLAMQDDKTKSDGELASIVIAAVIGAIVLGLGGASVGGPGGAIMAAGIGAVGGAAGTYFGIEFLEDNRRKVAEIDIRNKLPKFLGGEKPST